MLKKVSETISEIKKSVFSWFEVTFSSLGCIFCIVCVQFVSIVFLGRVSVTLAVLCASFCSCFLMIPLTLNLSRHFKNKTLEKDFERDKELLRQESEIEKLKQEQDETLRKLMLLEATKFNMSIPKNVLKLTLKEIMRNGTIVKKEQLNPDDFHSTRGIKNLFSSSRQYDEVLTVLNYTVSAKYGINLQNIKISKVNDSSIVVYGAIPEYTAGPDFSFEEVLGEVRHVNLHRNGREKNVTVENSIEASEAVRKKQEQYKSDFQEEFANMPSLQLDESLKKDAQNMIRVLLAPFYKNIEFDDRNIPQNSQPLLEYLQNSVKGIDAHDSRKELFDKSVESRADYKG